MGQTISFISNSFAGVHTVFSSGATCRFVGLVLVGHSPFFDRFTTGRVRSFEYSSYANILSSQNRFLQFLPVVIMQHHKPTPGCCKTYLYLLWYKEKKTPNHMNSKEEIIGASYWKHGCYVTETQSLRWILYYVSFFVSVWSLIHTCVQNNLVSMERARPSPVRLTNWFPNDLCKQTGCPVMHRWWFS